MQMGWNRWISVQSGLEICLYDYALDDRGLTDQASPEGDVVEIDFTLSGRIHVDIVNGNGGREAFKIRSGANGMYFLPAAGNFEARARVEGGEIPSGVNLRMDAGKLLSFAGKRALPLSAALSRAVVRPDLFRYEHFPITPAMRMVIEQILSPPVTESLLPLYLENKVLELIVLRLDQAAQGPRSGEGPDLNRKDRRNISLARDILVEEMADPPSIRELSRRAGINEFKLKAGFRKLFGDTIYRTLKKVRMEKARRLLSETDANVLTVANQVGYANPSHFAAAFRKTFGISPRTYIANRPL